MEGPTPVSALIHAATMVAAGVYLVGRIFPILTPDARLFIAIIGVTTLTMAALIAIVQSDIKKVLAFSTLSQLGYMIMAMGVASWVGGLFHLVTHAFFKALLFLGAGSVIHAAHHEQELPQYGGLWRKIPVTAATFFIAVLAIAGTPFLSGFFSKDMILAHAGAFASGASAKGSAWNWAFFILPTIIAYVTAFYMMRCWMLTFWGRPRNQHLYEHARERPVMYVPLVFLAFFSIISGYPKAMGVEELLVNSTREATAMVRLDQRKLGQAPTFAGFEHAWRPHAPAVESGEAPHGSATARAQAHERGEHLVHTWVFPAFLVGIGLAFVMYMRGYAVANALMKFAPVRWIHAWLYRRMFFDELYNSVIVGVTVATSYMIGWFDRFVVDGLVNLVPWCTRRLSGLVGLNDKVVVDGAVDGLADAAHALGAAVRAPQTGRIRLYVTVLAAMVALGLSAAIVVALM
jgi:NADH-quinone oxidoreductase subunit L